MPSKIVAQSLLAAVIAIPTHEIDKWQIDKYAKIPANKVSFSAQGMQIEVKASANPMIFPLGAGKSRITSFTVNGEFKSLPQFADPTKQGSKGADDYALRIGLIVPGDKKLSGIKKMFAPEWVKNLYEKIPAGLGLDHVHFFNVTQNPVQLGTSREHPGTDLIQEEFIESVSKAGPFRYEFKLKKPLEAVGLWLSVDGDDTKSDFTVVISQLELKSE